jgi:carboxyl-terminal processing protease
MKRRFLYGILLTALAVNLFFGAEAYFSNVQAAEKDEAYPNLKLFGVVLDRIRQEYVDGDKLSYQDLIHGALKGMLSTLDPHSEFMEPAKYDDLKKDTRANSAAWASWSPSRTIPSPWSLHGRHARVLRPAF